DRVAWERYVQSINHPNTFLEGNSLTVASISQSTGQTHLSHTTIDIATGWILNYEDRYSSSDTFYHISFEQVIESDIFSLLNVSGIPDGIGLVAVILVSLLGGAALAKALRWSQHRKGSIQQKQ
ncbi:MAG TPA: hypothetical protein VJ044_12120, partial [Candidatus Hodarchaeales archaeon]|nr:hypothetical protein [Candidatus Hodarchaeales archaeon]